MAHISDYRKLSSKLETLKEKLVFQHELYELDKVLIDEKYLKKLEKVKEKENVRLSLIAFAFADLEEEVNKRIVNRMRKYNVKDYWFRREAIQIYRQDIGNGFEAYKARLDELDSLKKAYEETKKDELRRALSKYILKDQKEIEMAKDTYNVEFKKSQEIIDQKEKELEALKEKELIKRDIKFNKTIDKLNLLIKETSSALANCEQESYALEDGIVLNVEHLTMQFGGLKAVDDLSFKVKEGEIFGLIGPNGAGKTTVFNCITQFYKPTAGNLYFKEKNGNTVALTDLLVHNVVKKGIIRTFQNVELVKEISVMDNLLVAAHSQYHSNLFEQFLHLPILQKEEIAMRKKVEEVLDFLDLTNYKNMLCWGLPYGILKRIEIARTLMNNPQLIILDEPAAGLNDSETVELRKIIKKIQEKYKCTILLVEHDMGLVMDVCDTVCAISFGKLLGIGTPAEIQANKEVQTAYLGSVEEE
jgi:branched-chain amino acid transport system ATP-binding protein